MTIKIDASNASKTLIRVLSKAKDEKVKATIEKWRPMAKKILKEEIEKHLARGQSPVEGGGGGTSGSPRFEKYSPSYTEQIKKGYYDKFGKKVRPVNLNLSGKMINSMRFDDIKDGVRIKFLDKKFEFHNFLGAGKSHVIRPILPLSSQSFNRLITRKLASSFVELFRKQ